MCSGTSGNSRLSAVMTARQFGHTVLTARHQPWCGRIVKWEEGLRLGVGYFPGARRQAAGLFALVAHPAGQERLGSVVHPLVEKGSDLPAQIGGTVKPGELVAFERGDRAVVKEVPGRTESLTGHYNVPRRCQSPCVYHKVPGSTSTVESPVENLMIAVGGASVTSEV